MKLLGNLDCEARWAGVALPGAVERRISLYATLLAACAPDGDRPEIWVPAEVDAARLIAHPGWAPPVVRAPAPPEAPPGAFDLAWADPAAAAANDRSRALAIAGELGIALPGARVVASLAELDAHLSAHFSAHFAGSGGRPWICKARWTAAGRDRARGTGALTGELRTRISRMLQRFGPLVFEPWLDRVLDLGVCGEVTAAEVRLLEPHRIATDPRGGFLGIELSPRLDPGVAERLCAVARAAATRLAAQTGYRGPFAIDAFVHRDPESGDSLHPLCEINARYSFGWIAHALARRLGTRRLGFDAPPPGATVLIAPGPDRVTAWCA
ncbi:MAG TPA: hypothetical protein VHT91_40235 [Kofleriaceae bacterium]|nr:hypothetical protein [Kofleriaceae bacterium]